MFYHIYIHQWYAVVFYDISDTDTDRGLFNIKLHTKVLHQVYIAKQYEQIEQIWTWHEQKYLLGDLYYDHSWPFP